MVDPPKIEKMVDEVLKEIPKQLEQYCAGKTKRQGYFACRVKIWGLRGNMLSICSPVVLFIFCLSILHKIHLEESHSEVDGFGVGCLYGSCFSQKKRK